MSTCMTTSIFIVVYTMHLWHYSIENSDIYYMSSYLHFIKGYTKVVESLWSGKKNKVIFKFVSKWNQYASEQNNSN